MKTTMKTETKTRPNIDPAYRLAAKRVLTDEAFAGYVADVYSIDDDDLNGIVREVENIAREQDEFFAGIASVVTNGDTRQATEVWAAYSRQLSDLNRISEESKGYDRGQGIGREIMALR